MPTDPPGLDPDVPKALSGYLLPSERLVVAIHQHWAVVARPLLLAGAALAVALVGDANVTPRTAAVGTALWWLFFAAAAYAAWRVLEWRHSWFAATDKRLLLTYGFITQKVSMMPMKKVTDMSFIRSVTGRLMGYGLFVLESAGQDQAMREIRWVPHPEITYRAICAEIFGGRRGDRAEVERESFENPWLDGEWGEEVMPGQSRIHADAALEEAGVRPPGRPGRRRRAEARADRDRWAASEWDEHPPSDEWDDDRPRDAWDEDRLAGEEGDAWDPRAGVRGLRETPHVQPTRDGESIYRSDDGDTGPIRYS